MRDYKAKRIIGGNEKHIVYYMHTNQNVPLSLGWNSSELVQIVEEDRHLSIYVGWKTTKSQKNLNRK